MRRGPLLVLSTFGLAFILVAVSACGGKTSQPTTPTPTPVLVKAQPGHVITNPTPAQSFIYLPRSTVQEPNGDILIADSGNWNRKGAKIVEMNQSGTPIWVYTGGLVFPHAAYPVGNNIVIADTGNDRVIEINRQGKTLWDSDYFGGGKGYLGQGILSNGAKLLYPNDAFPLPNGHFLVSSRFTNSVYEINQTGKVFWSCSRFMSRQHNPRLLPNGNLIVADSDNGRAIIINHSCTKIVFNYGGTDLSGVPRLLWPRSFQPYTRGNYVIGDSLRSRIIEINPKNKQIVQQWTNLPAPFYVTVLPNGDLLTQDSNIHGAIVLAPNGSTVRTYPTTDPNTYPTSVVNGGFENVNPRGWLKGDLLTETLPAGVRADMTFTTSQKHSGNSSGQITWPSNAGHLSLFWFQTLSVTPGKTYHFTGWIKVQGVKGCTECNSGPGTPEGATAVYEGAYSNPSTSLNPSVPALLLGQRVSGTTGWLEEKQTFTVPAGVTQLQLEARLDGRGTVYFDDVSLN